MFCQNCGKEISNQANVCPHCGKVVDKKMKGKKSSKVLDILSFVFLGIASFYSIFLAIALSGGDGLVIFLFCAAGLGCVIASVIIKKRVMETLNSEIESKNIKESNKSDK